MQRFAKTEIRLSDTFDFPRKSFRLFHFTYQATWLALALEALFWRVSGTIVGTVPTWACCPIMTDIDKTRYPA